MTERKSAPTPKSEESNASHWDDVYRRKEVESTTWFQHSPEPSLTWIRAIGLKPDAAVIDVGGGAATLVDGLLDHGFARPTVLDVSEIALSRSKERLGDRAVEVEWIVADVVRAKTVGIFDVWHDRAVFHFLVDEADRRRYVELAARSIKSDGRLIVATFDVEAPPSCCGLPVRRHDASTLASVFSPHFRVERSERSIHKTPTGALQPFTFVQFVREI